MRSTAPDWKCRPFTWNIPRPIATGRALLQVERARDRVARGRGEWRDLADPVATRKGEEIEAVEARHHAFDLMTFVTPHLQQTAPLRAPLMRES